MTKRASYREGVAWIAQNDETEEVDPATVQGFISTLLLADLFDKDPENVAEDIIRYRKKNGIV